MYILHLSYLYSVDKVPYLYNYFQVYPIWLCPFKLPCEPGLVHSYSDKDELYVDIGLYGTPMVEEYDSVKTTKEMEQYVAKVKG